MLRTGAGLWLSSKPWSRYTQGIESRRATEAAGDNRRTPPPTRTTRRTLEASAGSPRRRPGRGDSRSPLHLGPTRAKWIALLTNLTPTSNSTQGLSFGRTPATTLVIRTLDTFACETCWLRSALIRMSIFDGSYFLFASNSSRRRIRAQAVEQRCPLNALTARNCEYFFSDFRGGKIDESSCGPQIPSPGAR